MSAMSSGLRAARVRRRTAADTFAWVTHSIHDWLPRLLKWIPVTWLGFAILGLTSFGIDMVVLTILHGALKVPYPFAVTIGYAVASIANFILNRWLNFQVHGDIGRQSTKQLLVVVSNYVIWILAFSTVLEMLGVQYQVARVVAACVEGMYLYLMMRLWVFPRKKHAEPQVVRSSRSGRILL
jgi:putative flippase GtrA